jgi:hypothetical protein
VDQRSLDAAARSSHDMALAQALAEQALLERKEVASVTELLDSDAAQSLGRLEQDFSSNLWRQSAAGVFDGLAKLDIVRTGLRTVGAWTPDDTVRWVQQVETLRSRTEIFLGRDAPVQLQPANFSLRTSTVMLNYQPETGTPARENVAETTAALAEIQREISAALSNAPVAQADRLLQVREHVWFLYELIGDPDRAPAQVDEWRRQAHAQALQQ